MNKTFRYYRTHHARKGSLKDNLKDVFDRSAQCASPEILCQIEASLNPKQKNRRPLPESIRPLLVFPHLYEFEEPPLEILPDFSPATSEFSTPGSSIPDEDTESDSSVDVAIETDSTSSSESSDSSDDMEVDSDSD